MNCYIQKGIDIDGEMPEGTSTLSEGMIVTVEDENNVGVRRIDGARNEEIGEQLVDMLAERLPMKEVAPDAIDRLLAKLHL